MHIQSHAKRNKWPLRRPIVHARAPLHSKRHLLPPLLNPHPGRESRKQRPKARPQSPVVQVTEMALKRGVNEPLLIVLGPTTDSARGADCRLRSWWLR